MLTSRTTYRGFTIERYSDAVGTNLVDKSQSVLVVSKGNFRQLMGRWTTLCLPKGSVTADKATDKQIVDAVLGDESVI